MNFKSFLIKYAEIAIKGKNRYQFEDALVHQIKNCLKKCDGTFKVSKTVGRVYVEAETDFDSDEVINALQHVFGITRICPVVRVPDMGFDDLSEQVIRYMDETYPDTVSYTHLRAHET